MSDNPALGNRAPWRRTLAVSSALSLGIALVLMLNDVSTLFRVPYYEMSDIAANSLAVRDAREFHELYGPYSRWGFHHPGPALFYLYAAGEKLFCDWLHLVPTPGNAQLLTTLLLNSVLLGASLGAFARFVSARGFLPLALALATLHFAMVGPWVFFSPWSAHILVVMFLALLVAGACVAAGSGEQLPLLVFASGLLVHLHVAQPLFVVPLTALAYYGLMRSIHRAANGERRKPWRVFPRAHWLAGALLLLFVLPLLIDACAGANSNLAKILAHQRTHAGDHKSLFQSVLYFMQYGAYLGFEPGQQQLGQLSAAAMVAFLRSHALLYSSWLVAFAVPVGWFVRLLRRRGKDAVLITAQGRFLFWASAFLVGTLVLTLVWGIIQDGELYYHNAFFNYAIYLFAGLLSAAAFALWLAQWRSRIPQVAFWILLATAVWWRAPLLRGFNPGIAEAAALHLELRHALENDPAGRAPKLLLFEQPAWPVATGVVLQLERLGVRAYVPDRWAVMFGSDRTIGSLRARLADIQSPPWRLVPAASAPPAAERLGFDYALLRDVSSLDPMNGRVMFGSGGNASAFPSLGLSGADVDSAGTVGHTAALWFRPAPATADVELTVSVSPFLAPPRLVTQRIRLFINTHPVGEFSLAKTETLVCRIPVVIWNERPVAVLSAELPDAASPASLGMSKDPALLALTLREITLQLLPP